MPKKFHLELGKPVVVKQGEVGDTAWGNYQFPAFYRTEKGGIYLHWEYGKDNIDYQSVFQCAISDDEGKTWRERTPEDTLAYPLMKNGKRFAGFERKKGFFPVQYVCTTEYDATMPNVEVAYPREKLTNIFGEYISRMGMTQLRIAETEKYAHVTFFFNGGVEQTFPGEDRCLIASPKVATYDLQPEMSAPQVTEECVRRIESGEYDVVILNFANCDMVGHTGVFEAAVKAAEAVDEGVARVVEATAKMGGVSIITADHGNAEHMMEEDGSPFTAHTTNLVPCCIVGADVKLRDGRLADICPTMLDLMGLHKPEEMTGETLILK